MTKRDHQRHAYEVYRALFGRRAIFCENNTNCDFTAHQTDFQMTRIGCPYPLPWGKQPFRMPYVFPAVNLVDGRFKLTKEAISVKVRRSGSPWEFSLSIPIAWTMRDPENPLIVCRYDYTESSVTLVTNDVSCAVHECRKLNSEEDVRFFCARKSTFAEEILSLEGKKRRDADARETLKELKKLLKESEAIMSSAKIPLECEPYL